MDLKTYQPIKAGNKKNVVAADATDDAPPAKKAKKTSSAAAKSKASKAKKPKPEPVVDQDQVARAASPPGPFFKVSQLTPAVPPSYWYVHALCMFVHVYHAPQALTRVYLVQRLLAGTSMGCVHPAARKS